MAHAAGHHPGHRGIGAAIQIPIHAIIRLICLDKHTLGLIEGVAAAGCVAASAVAAVAEGGENALLQQLLLRWWAFSHHKDGFELAIGASFENFELLLVVLHVLLNHILILLRRKFRLLDNFLQTFL